MSATAMPKSRLYRTARRLAASPTTDFEDLGRGVQHAVQAIVDTIARTVDAKVTAAATVGATQLDILRFHGNDLDEVSGFPMLTLVKGPRDTDLRAVSGPTLVEALEEALSPFEVVHTWHSRSNMNRIILRWQHEDAGDDDEDDDDEDSDEEAAVEDSDEASDEEETQETLDAQHLLQALQRQLAAVESQCTLPEIPEEEEEEEAAPGEIQDLQASLSSLLRALQ